jgi:hypothetical protein
VYSVDFQSDESDVNTNQKDDQNGSSEESTNIDEDEIRMENSETASDPKKRKLSTVQQVSFHKIMKTRNDLKGLGSEEVIKKIVNSYNNKNRKAEYKKESSTEIIQLNMQKQFGFQIMIYTQKYGGSSRLLKKYGIHFVQNTCNVVIFHYNSDCLFAVTKGAGWRLIQRYVDYDFPQKVAARILSEDGRKSFTDRQLLGNARSVNKTLKTDEPTDPFAAPSICTKFTARLRPNASILELKCFKTIKKSLAYVSVEIGFGSVRFKKEFEVEDFFLILDHLNKIDKGEKTLTTDGGEEKQSEAFYRYLHKVSPVDEDKLNTILVERIRDGIQNNKMNYIQQFDFCHKYADSFSYGSKFTLKYNNHIVKRFRNAPSLENIFNYLQTAEKCKALHNKNCSIEKYRKRLCNVKISFETDKDIIRSKLLDYIEGYIFYDNQYYWRVMTKWCCVSEDYLKLIQIKFVKLLNKRLIGPDELGRLDEPWKNEDEEDDYNKKYASKNGFIVGDKSTVKTIELFDLMFHDQESNLSFLYHVKKGFGQSTRDACSQVINCANIIRLSMQGNSNQLDIIKEAYEKYSKNWKHEIRPDFISSCDKFKRALERAIFVYAVAPNLKLRSKTSQLSINHYYGNQKKRKESRSLHLEKNFKSKIFANDISSLLKQKGEKFYKKIAESVCETKKEGERNLCQILGEKIVDKLKDENYIDSKGEVTSKLLYCTKKSFKLSCFERNAAQNERIFYLLSPYLSFFDSLGAKLEVIRTCKELAENEFDNKFKIFEIIGAD